MGDKAVITCPLNGVLTDPKQHNVPVTPEQLVRETRPEIAACNAGSLNYLKVKSDNTWAWPPMMFDNAVEKVQDYLDVMKEAGTIPEFECFDVGIVRCVGMYRQTGMYSGPLEYNFVMGVASRMPADPELLPILLKLKLPEAHWQVTAIGREEIWPLQQRCAEPGGQASCRERV